MHIRLTANTKNEIDSAEGMLVFFNCPKDTPEIRENIRGLITTLHRARYYVSSGNDDVLYHYTARSLDGIEVHFMSDELLSSGVNSLVEIQFTLKHMLTLFGSYKDIHYYIPKPTEPTELDGNPKLSQPITESIFEYNINNFDPATGLTTKQQWGLADILVKSLLKYDNPALDPVTPFDVKSLLEKMGNGKSLEEIEFTLKHLLTQIGSDKDVQFFIDKPAEPAKDNNGEWIATDNKSITSERGSVFVTEQYIDPLGFITQKFSIADVIATATVEGQVVVDPIGQSLFRLTSKFDSFRYHFLNEFTDLMNYFASAFREGSWSPISLLNNPFSNQSIYQMLLDTFNDTQKTYATIPIPFWGNTSVPVWTKQHSFIDKLNQNLALSFNEDFDANTDLASNSHFRNLDSWLTTIWKEFHDVMNAMKDCICALTASTTNPDGTSKFDDLKDTIKEGNDAINGGTGKPTLTGIIETLIEEIKAGNGTNEQGIQDIATAIKEMIANDNTDDGCETTDNGDGTYTTKPILKPSEPVAPYESEKYQGGGVKGKASHDAICGFIWYACNWTADTIWWILGLFGAVEAAATYMAETTGIGAASSMVIDMIGAAPQNLLNSSGGESLVKQGTSLANLNRPVARTIISKLLTIRAASIEVLSVGMSPLVKKGWARGFSIVAAMIILPDLLKAFADELACGESEISNNLYNDWSDDKFVNSVLNYLTDNIIASNTIGLPLDILEDIIGLVGYLLSVGIDTAYMGSAGRAFKDYKQYCPCPLTGLFNGNFWNGVTGNGEKWLYLESDMVTVNGTVTSMNLFGTLYESDIINCVVDINNELVANGTSHVTSHTGFPDSAFTIATIVNGDEVYYVEQTFTRQ